MEDLFAEIKDMIDKAGASNLPVEVDLSNKTIKIMDNDFPISELYGYLKNIWESEEKYTAIDFPIIVDYPDILRSES